jgi:hypothetical protein
MGKLAQGLIWKEIIVTNGLEEWKKTKPNKPNLFSPQIYSGGFEKTNPNVCVCAFYL